LEADLNPFAVVVMAHLKTQETRRDPEARRQWKFSLTRRLYERGYSRQDILDLFRFIDWVMILPPELEQQFEADLSFYEEQRTMRYVTTIERRAEERGIEQGIEQGIEKGLEQGSVLTLRTNIVDALRIRFGEVAPALVERISSIDDISLLQTLFRQALTALTLAEVEQALTNLLASDLPTDQ
jgi:flagellar biosynthesis/type III secretory pathway protein FliH